MIRITQLSAILALWGATSLFATDYIVTTWPIGTCKADSVIQIRWTGGTRTPPLSFVPAPDSGRIYYDRSPGGGHLANYRYTVSKPWTNDSTKDNQYYPLVPPVRGIAFRPIDQTDMSSGIFYCVVAWPVRADTVIANNDTTITRGDTLVSNEFQVLVESPNSVTPIGPIGTISSLTPTFTWNANQGVPYYHVILSDEPFRIDSSSGQLDVTGLSIVWQAITPNTQIVYGTPDPSHTITAEPPPLSPGKFYTWIVLNNYGNNPEFTSFDSYKLPAPQFSIAGKQLNAPVNVYPINNAALNSQKNPTINFQWTNLDSNAVTYKIYVYIAADYGGLNAQLAVWQNEIPAGTIRSHNDTMSASVDAASLFTSHTYTWRVTAVDNTGAGTSGDSASFSYSSPTGTLILHTREHVVTMQNGKPDTVSNVVGLAQVNVQVLSGSLEAPLLFYTDVNGDMERDRPAGTYRMTVVKDGFEPFSRTITIDSADTVEQTLYLQRPDAEVFGKVLDQSGQGIDLATVAGVSDRGDTVQTQTDPLGNFIINCYAADWTIGINKAGYVTSISRKVTVPDSQNVNFGSDTLAQNPFTLSGIVKNPAGEPILGVNVEILQAGSVLNSIPSTPQTGAFSFALGPGNYTISATKAGFQSFSGPVQVSGSKSITITLGTGGIMVNGYVIGRTWVGSSVLYAAVPNAYVKMTDVATADTFVATTDAVYGNFTIGVPKNSTYVISSSAQGYVPAGGADTVRVDSTALNRNDSLRALGMLSGTVKMHGTVNPASGVTVSLLNPANGALISSVNTAFDGSFEIDGIPDGTFRVNAARQGLKLDSIGGGDSIVVTDGRCGVQNMAIFVSPGDITVKWKIANAENFTGSVKMKSPIQQTFAPGDSMQQMGPGDYIEAVDASPDSILDLSYHHFTLTYHDTISKLYVDTVRMGISHHIADTLSPSNDSITLNLASHYDLDSAILFYKDINGSAFSSLKIAARDSLYNFKIVPPSNGALIQYYFQAFSGSDIYGYAQELTTVFIAPDTNKLTKHEIFPVFGDTALFPSNSSIALSLRAYVSSVYLPAPVNLISPDSISWALAGDNQGCSLSKTTGLSTVLTTPDAKITSAVMLTVKLAAGISRAAGVPLADTMFFLATGTKVKTISIRRTDSKNPNPISTASVDQAEFVADGVDQFNNVLSVSPTWSINPPNAGMITAEGVYKPNSDFIGFVRVFAQIGPISGEYNPVDLNQGITQPGLEVDHLLVDKPVPDTATNLRGLTIIFPRDAVTGSDVQLMKIAVPDLRNQIKRGIGSYQMVDSMAYDISPVYSVPFNFAKDSISIAFDVSSLGQANCFVGLWNADSLLWNPVAGSKDTLGVARAKIGHFSRYAAIAQLTGYSSFFMVSPSPFSPYIRPDNEWRQKYGSTAPYYGTCIHFKIGVPGQVVQVKLRIYNLVGALVWSTDVANAVSNEEYQVWWDGKTLSNVTADGKDQTPIFTKGDKMCRNGRYFVVLTTKDSSNKQRQDMKPVILMK